MQKILMLATFVFFIGFSGLAQKDQHIEFIAKFSVPNSSIRAIEVLDQETLWFAGSNGRYGRIIDNKLEIDSISHEGKFPHFRAIAYNGAFIFLLSIENPALLFKIDPNGPLGEYELVYHESHEKVFYDSLTFFDKKRGIAMGDPIDNCLSILLTEDGGNSWEKLNCTSLPEIFKGEAAFAASNTNIATIGKNAWVVTGGAKARVFKTESYGHQWEVTESPLVHGSQMTGIFSTDFYDEHNGIVMGGDWENKKSNQLSKAVTKNGGKSWDLIAENQLPGYISCVQYAPGENGKKLLAVSTEGIYQSEDGGNTWRTISGDGYFSIRFIDHKTAWLSKNEEIAKIKIY